MRKKLQLTQRQIGLILIIGLEIRLITAFFAPPSGDVEQFARTGFITLSGLNVYTLSSFYNYAPPLAFLLAGTAAVSHFLSLPLPFLIRTLFILADLVTALLIYAVGGSKSFRAYWLNPAVIASVAIWGQFDTIPVAWVIACMHLLYSFSSASGRWSLSTSSSSSSGPSSSMH